MKKSNTTSFELRKYRLIESIIHLRDEQVLGKHEALMWQFKKNSSIDFWNELTEVEKESIELSIKQLEAGEGIPHETVMAEFRKRYEASLKPMTYKELEERALVAEEDIKAGRLTDIEDLMQEIKP
ncbi:MAG: hypothetical protein AAB316_04255 [Bacteroidota bacterium]